MGEARGWTDWKLVLVIGLAILSLALAGCVNTTEDPGTNTDGNNGATTNGGGGNGGGGGGTDDGNQTGNETTPPGNELDTDRLEDLMHNYINQQRQENNIQQLTHSQSLRVAAREYSREMLENTSSVQFGENMTYVNASKQDRLDRYDKHNALECDRTPGSGAENAVVTKYGRAVQQADGDRVVYNSIERLAQGIVSDIRNTPGMRNKMFNTTFRYQGIGARYNRSTATVYVTQSLC